MRGRRRVLAFVAVVCLLGTLAVAGAAATPADRVLVVEDAATGERLIETPVENGTVVALEYTHSVEKTRVLDAFTVRGDELVMTRMEFESYGWGLPAGAEVTRENGTFSFDPSYASEELVVKPGRTAGHRLHVDSQTYDLVERSDARAVRLSIERRSVLDATLDRSAPYIGAGA
ncbi:DUF1850 domain-containing protein [Halalkalicoccus jeotgali]|uniref:DUF1850 domain-containing protein n=1 Tax=Halalkalicoccus jeotgali (strain DSM 18796 / CECT 7217 / JCM 14584 / KCTC 4019 / B3) TaxID=795797 RepID=D8J4D3_HALJB|nr:DUF1850 domain-containing protein [Halalkalicoccus jeotgali]ADJ13495.1 hypothetical protein HacjB3_00510 [Halalkalicoccus jeotgali B3]ELY33030.1 hypothetical protein C497_18822 [Halalkalicoccus jeotgali B3]